MAFVDQQKTYIIQNVDFKVNFQVKLSQYLNDDDGKVIQSWYLKANVIKSSQCFFLFSGSFALTCHSQRESSLIMCIIKLKHRNPQVQAVQKFIDRKRES